MTQASEVQEAQAPAAKTGHRLLIHMEETALGEHVARIGTAVATAMKAEVVFLVTVPLEHVDAKSPASLPDALLEHRLACEARTKPLFDRVQAAAKSAGVGSQVVLTIDEGPAAAAMRVAKERSCDLMVVGSTRRGAISKVLHRSLSDEVISESSCPVLVCQDDMGFGAVNPAPAADAAADDDAQA